MTEQTKGIAPKTRLIERTAGGTLGLLHRKAAVDTYLMTLNSVEEKTLYTIMFGEVPLDDFDGPEHGVQRARHLSGRQTRRLGLALEHPCDHVPELTRREAWYKTDES